MIFGHPDCPGVHTFGASATISVPPNHPLTVAGGFIIPREGLQLVRAASSLASRSKL